MSASGLPGQVVLDPSAGFLNVTSGPQPATPRQSASRRSLRIAHIPQTERFSPRNDGDMHPLNKWRRGKAEHRHAHRLVIREPRLHMLRHRMDVAEAALEWPF